MTSKLLLVACWAGLAACAHTHSPRNAPGNIDVHQPPADLPRRSVEEPADPGEQLVTISAGALGGGGVAFGGDDDTRGVYAVGPEASLEFGTRSRSHADDDFFIMAERSGGVNLGNTSLTSEGDGIGPFYGEVFYQEMIAELAGGWAWDPNDRAHGPQLTLQILALYVRATHLFDFGTQIQGGLVVKLPYSFISSR